LAPVITWSDDFDGPAGSPPGAWWTAEVGPGADRELQTYRAQNAALDGAGRLAITARREPDGARTSARLITKGAVALRHGRVEARIQVPAGRGMWPAFWMLGTDIDAVGWPECGEIDVMEVVGSEPRTVHGTLHGPGYAGVEHGIGTAHDTGEPLADGFHVYGVDWRPGRVTWLLDGEPYATLEPADVPAGAWRCENEFYLLLNLAIGGPWPGNEVEEPQLPASMLVDWVRVRR
jgi:beta-glucanase (GH16 family)